jgi:hypothetical protein
MSSRRPRNGLTYAAPALAARSACGGEKTSVVLMRIPSDDSVLIALRPPLADHGGGLEARDLGADRARGHDGADLAHRLVEVAALLRDEGGVGGDAVEDPPGVGLADLLHVRGIEEYLHDDLRARPARALRRVPAVAAGRRDNRPADDVTAWIPLR